MVAITSNQPTFAPQSNSALPTAELRAVPEQERPVNNQDNAVAAPQNTRAGTNENAQPQKAPVPAQPTEAVSQAQQQLQRAAVESSATTPQPEANQELSQVRTQETPIREAQPQEAQPQEARVQVERARAPVQDNVQDSREQEAAPAATTSAPAQVAESPPTTTAGAAAAVSTYQQVSSINENRTQRVDSSDDQAVESTSRALTSAPEKAEQASTERQVFGGAIDAANT